MQIVDWHDRYKDQAQWTKTLRQYLLTKLPIRSNWFALELGCGTGAILQDFSSISDRLIGLDKDLDALAFQGQNRRWLVDADAYDPPFQKKSFDLIFCHYFLLWLEKPVDIIQQIKSLLKPGGYLAFFAEPDYASRQTEPEKFKKLANLQNKSSAAQGAYLKIGRELGRLLREAEFELIEFGSMKEKKDLTQIFTESEKKVLRADWAYLHQIREAEMANEEMEDMLLQSPTRWYIPTYYALAELNQ